MKYFGVNVTQGTQATYQFGASHGVNCSVTPTPSVCISGGQVEIGHYGFTYNQKGANNPLSPTEVQDQIYTRDEPFIINPNGPGFGHVLVAIGFINLDDIAQNLYFVGINDPWPSAASYDNHGRPTGPVSGEFYWEPYDAYSEGVWEGVQHSEGYDYYNIKPPTPRSPKTPSVMLKPPQSHTLISHALAARVLAGNVDPVKAANDALLLASKLVTAESAPKLGFPNLESLKNIRLGAAVEQYVMSTPKLRLRQSSQAATEVLEKVPTLFFPIEGDPLIHASIRMRQKNGIWRLASFGCPALTLAWQNIKKNGGEFMIHIESAETALSGRKVGGQLLVSPLFDHPELSLKAGLERKVEEVLPALTEVAKRYNPSLLNRP